MHRIFLIAILGVFVAIPATVFAQTTSSADEIGRTLDTALPEPGEKVTIEELKRRPDIREKAPSIDIQTINFAFDSDEIPRSEYGKVENIAVAMRRLVERNPDARVLLEGHTDAAGPAVYNQALSDRRAAALERLLVSEFQIPERMLETVGYGEEFPVVATEEKEPRNRRVTLRRVDQLLGDE